MNGIASALLQLGVDVSGSDRQDSKYLRALEAQGARVHVGHDAAQLGSARTVVASSAIREDNPELAEARRRGLRVLHRSAALGSIMLGRRGVAVAGTHGKTTTTGDDLARPLPHRGRSLVRDRRRPDRNEHRWPHRWRRRRSWSRLTSSDGSFLQYPAEIAVVTNVDPDHLSNWGTAENYADGFLRFATGGSVAAAGDQRGRPRRGDADRTTPVPGGGERATDDRHVRRERGRRRPDHRRQLRRHRFHLRARRRTGPD